MINGKLASEFQAISQELGGILANERDAAIALGRRFAEDQRAIEKLLQSIQEAKLSGNWLNTRFNVFDILRRPRLEQAHSGFLAWLLDPAEAHGLGDVFLRKFMRQAIGKEPPATGRIEVSTEFPCGGRFSDIHVEGPGWQLIVENKIDDSAWEDQCHDYQAYCRKVMGRGEQAWLVYVTPPAHRPSDRTIPWLPYREVRLILESLSPDASAAALIENFCGHIISDLEV